MTKSQVDDLEAVRKVAEAIVAFDPGDQERILRWARERVGLNVGAPTAFQPTPSTDAAAGTTASSIGNTTDIKSFVESKKPGSETQFAATVAYYFRFKAPEQMRKESIVAADLQEACRQVDRDRLRKPAQTLINAHSQGLLDRGERGAYTINTVGENLVAMALPAGGARIVAKRPKTKVPRRTKSPRKHARKAKR